MKTLLFLITFCFLSSCLHKIDVWPSPEGRWYQIKEGNHYPEVRQWQLPAGRKFNVEFALGTGTWHKVEEIDDQDYSKIGGICFRSVHDTSFRFGYRPKEGTPGVYELVGYVYDNGERRFVPIGEIDQYRLYKFTIELSGSTRIIIKSSELDIDVRIKVKDTSARPMYVSFPYIGGNKPAREGGARIFWSIENSEYL